jgi:hypothetical protein
MRVRLIVTEFIDEISCNIKVNEFIRHEPVKQSYSQAAEMTTRQQSRN